MTTTIDKVQVTINADQQAPAFAALISQTKFDFSGEAKERIKKSQTLHCLLLDWGFKCRVNLKQQSFHISGATRILNDRESFDFRILFQLLAPYIKNKSIIYLKNITPPLEDLDAVWFFNNKCMTFFEKQIFEQKMEAEKEKKKLNQIIKKSSYDCIKIIKV